RSARWTATASPATVASSSTSGPSGGTRRCGRTRWCSTPTASSPAARSQVRPHGNDFEFILRSWEKDLLGKLTGMVFVQYMLGALVHSFDWRLPDGEEELDMEEKHGLTISKAVPLKVLLTPRLSAAAYI
ncbi:Cytochrome P450, partial [Musa troglodytarum]